MLVTIKDLGDYTKQTITWTLDLNHLWVVTKNRNSVDKMFQTKLLTSLSLQYLLFHNHLIWYLLWLDCNLIRYLHQFRIWIHLHQGHLSLYHCQLLSTIHHFHLFRENIVITSTYQNVAQPSSIDLVITNTALEYIIICAFPNILSSPSLPSIISSPPCPDKISLSCRPSWAVITINSNERRTTNMHIAIDLNWINSRRVSVNRSLLDNEFGLSFLHKTYAFV